MANKITLENLQINMQELLKPFNNEGVEVNNDTIHSAVLATDDGFTISSSSAKLYSGGLQWILWRNGGTKVKFPTNWMDQSVTELSEFIISKQIA